MMLAGLCLAGTSPASAQTAADANWGGSLAAKTSAATDAPGVVQRSSAPKVMAAENEEEPQYRPDKATNVTVTFNGVDTVGTVSFDAPTTLYGSNPPVGWLKYQLKDVTTAYPYTVVAEDYCEYGEHVSFELTATPGYHQYTIYMVNAKGQSSSSPTFPYTTTSVYVGPGIPSKVKNLSLTANGNEVTLTWEAVTSATHSKAFFEPSEVTYTVVRMPDDITVAEGIAETTFSETLPVPEQPKGYAYKVKADFRGQISDDALSPGVPMGSATPAWSTQINTVYNFSIFTVVDANADGYTWKWDAPLYDMALAAYNSSYTDQIGKDDWLISPAINVEEGKLYPVEFEVGSYNDLYTETFEMKGGTGLTFGSLTDVIAEPTAVNTTEDQRYRLKGYFLAPATGKYYVGLHAMTAARTYNAKGYSFSVGAGLASTSPEGVSDLSITSDPDVVPPTAVIIFKAPATDVNGAPLASLTKIEIARNGEVVKTFDNPAPGAELTYSDIVPENGDYTYTLTASNDTGAGRVIEKTAFVGDYRLYPPFSYDFPDDSWTKTWTIINVDGDSKKWEHDTSNGYAKCSSTSGQENSDYLVLPALWLKAGFRYTFSMNIKSYYNGDEVPFEVVVGEGNTPEVLTTVIGGISGTESNIGNSEWKTVSYTFDAQHDGNYNFAIHYQPTGSMCILCVDQVSVSNGLNVGAPKAIDDFTVTPDFGGELKAEITFTAPSKSMAETDLTTNLSKIDLKRDGELITSFSDVAPGTALSYTDETATLGYHNYTVTPYALSEGETSSTRVYVGVNVPVAPTAATITEPETGSVKITWTAPATDIDGEAINTGLVKYNIYSLSLFGEEPAPVASNVTGTEYTATPEMTSQQQFFAYRIYAVTASGVSESYADTEFIPVGESYTLPFAESFAEGKLSYEFMSETLGDYPTEWRVYSDRSMANLEPQDGDNGVIAMLSPYTVGQSHLISGKIDLTGAVSPEVSIWYRAVKDCECSLGLDIREVGQTEFTELVRRPAWDSETEAEWTKVSASLADYAGKTVQIAVYGNMSQHNYLFFDNFRVSELHPVDVAVFGLTAPARMYPGEEATISVRFQNRGTETLIQNSYTVDLYRNGELAQTVAGPALAPDRTTEVVFHEIPSVASDLQLSYYAKVNVEGDAVPSDNTTATAEVELRVVNLPAVSDLTVTTESGVNSLSWSAPSVPETGTTGPVTEDFESYPSFTKANLGDWMLVDADAETFAGFKGISLPGISGPISFFVMDCSYDGISYDPDGVLSANSGTKYMASAYTAGPTFVSDDWLISPQISQDTHAISFYAKSYDATVKETFQLLYSTKGRATADFESLAVVADVPQAWTKYDYELPEGARYFAIRCTSADKFMLFVDDVTYTPMVPETEGLIIEGYNVFRNGSLITPTPVKDATAFADNECSAGDAADYTVTTLYRQGESAHSNVASVVTSALGSAAADNVKVTAVDGNVMIEGANGQAITMASADGRVLCSLTGAPRTVIPAPQGVVLVTVGARVYKLAVR